MSQGNAIIDLGGGASADNIIAVKQDVPSKNKFSFVHKDGHATVIDMNAFAVDFQVEGFAWKGGDPTLGILQLEVKDHHANMHTVDIDLNLYVRPITSKKVDKVTHTAKPGAVNKSGELVLSEENFTTAIMKKINALPTDVVADVKYDATTEDITVSYAGSGGKTDYVIGALADKVAKKTGWELSQNDLTDAIKAVYDQFDPAGIKEVQFNPVNGEFKVSTYAAPSTFTVVFTIPVQSQADWKEINTAAPSYIKNKDLIQDQIDANVTDIAINKAEITKANTTTTALDVLVHKNLTDITAQETEIHDLQVETKDIRTELATLDHTQSKMEAEAIADRTDIATNASDIGDLQAKNNKEDGEIASLITRMTKNEAADNIRDISISTVEGEMVSTVANTAKNTADIASNTTAIASHAGLIQNNTTDLTLVQNKANVNETDIAGNRTNIATNTNNIAIDKVAINKNATDIAKNVVDIHQNASDINTLKVGIGMSDDQIRDAVQRAFNSNVLDDAEQAKLNNMPNDVNATFAAHEAKNVAARLAAATKATKDFVNVTGDTMTGDLKLPGGTAADAKSALASDSYATAAIGGSVKVRISATKLYLTIDGSNA